MILGNEITDLISEFLGAILGELGVIEREIGDELVRVCELLVDTLSSFRSAQSIFGADDKGDWNAVVDHSKVNRRKVSITLSVFFDRNILSVLILDSVLSEVIQGLECSCSPSLGDNGFPPPANLFA